MKPDPAKVQEALRYKEEGNKCFRSGKYEAADSFYTKAIIAQPSNPILYTNRAMAQLKLQRWDSIIQDCQTAISLSPETMKAHYYLSQALLELSDTEAALSSAETAYALCVANRDRSTATVGQLVLTCKKQRWDARERRRRREAADLEREVMEAMRLQWEAAEEEESKAADGDVVSAEEKREMWEAKMERLKDVFERSRKEDDRKREVPDWAVDDISFGFMVDPVMTKTGRSYERASILDHLNRHSSDPLTREPLTKADLRPNLGLKQACEEFLEKNGWAADW